MEDKQKDKIELINQKIEEQILEHQQPLLVNASQYLRQQLIAMQFEPHLIQQALKTTNTLDQAIQYIINLLEEQQPRELSNLNEVKLIVLVRMDLKMGMGKIAAQCAHVTLKAFHQARSKAQHQQSYAFDFIEWLQKGRPILFFKVQDEHHLFSLTKAAQGKKIGHCHIRDAGRTQIAAGSVTVAAIGPVQQHQVREIVKLLKLF